MLSHLNAEENFAPTRRIRKIAVTAISAAFLLSAGSAFAVDTDGDGVDDPMDNCTLVANPDQRDTNGDLYGNVCDPDLDNNGDVNFLDLGIMKSVFFTTDPDADLDGEGNVNFFDLGIMKAFFFLSPGPSGPAEAPKYTADIQPIFSSKCTPCHTGLGLGDHDIGTVYEDAFLPADDFDECDGLNVGQCTIVLIQSGEMPQGFGCTGDPVADAGNPFCLTQADQDNVQAWIDAGMPE